MRVGAGQPPAQRAPRDGLLEAGTGRQLGTKGLLRPGSLRGPHALPRWPGLEATSAAGPAGEAARAPGRRRGRAGAWGPAFLSSRREGKSDFQELSCTQELFSLERTLSLPWLALAKGSHSAARRAAGGGGPWGAGPGGGEVVRGGRAPGGAARCREGPSQGRWLGGGRGHGWRAWLCSQRLQSHAGRCGHSSLDKAVLGEPQAAHL